LESKAYDLPSRANGLGKRGLHEPAVPATTDAGATFSWQEGVTALAVLVGLHLSNLYSDLLFESISELFSIFIAVCVFVIVINCWDSIRNRYLLVVGVTFLSSAVLDLLHTLSFRTMPIFPPEAYYGLQFATAAHYVQSLGLLAGFGALGARGPLNRALLTGAALAVTVALTASILVFHVYPACFVPGRGLTPFKVGSEYFICGVFALNLFLLKRNRRSFDPLVYRLLGWAMAGMIAIELCFTMYSFDPHIFSAIGHLLKIGAFYCVYKALVVTGLRNPVRLLFRELKQSEENLVEAQRLARLGRWQCDPRSGRWTWSGEILALLGVEASAAPGLEPLLARLDQQDQRALAEAISQLAKGGPPFELVLRLHAANGQVLVGQMRGGTRIDTDGEVECLAGTLQDVTDQQRALHAAELAREKEKFEALVQTSGDGIHVVDPEGGVVEVNEKFCRMLGYTRRELLQMKVWQWEAYFSREEIRSRLPELLRRERVFETRHRRKDGALIDVEISAKAVSYADRTLVWAASRDITERKQTESRLKLAAGVFTHAAEGIVITDAEANIIDVNAAFTRTTGYGRDEAIGRNPRLLRSGRHAAEFYGQMWGALTEKGQWSGEIWNRRKNGEIYAVALNISAVQDAMGRTQNYVGMFVDITHIKEHEQQLERLAHYDALTGLPNRVLLADRLRQAIRHNQRRGTALAVALLDLDDFKSVNDDFEHAVGDEFLVAIAQSMKTALREEDTVARLAGDEFVAVLGGLESLEEADPILGRLLQAVSAKIPVGELALQRSASIGVSFFPQDGAGEPTQLLEQADRAMYRAKRAGGNRICRFDPRADSD